MSPYRITNDQFFLNIIFTDLFDFIIINRGFDFDFVALAMSYRKSRDGVRKIYAHLLEPPRHRAIYNSEAAVTDLRTVLHCAYLKQKKQLSYFPAHALDIKYRIPGSVFWERNIIPRDRLQPQYLSKWIPQEKPINEINELSLMDQR